MPSRLKASLDKRGLTHVIRHLGRSTGKGRDRLATDSLTIAYLEAGRRLFERLVTGRLAPRRRRRTGESEDERPTLRWLTRDLLFEEVRQGPHPLPRRPTPGTFRDRWRRKADFTADLIAYILWPGHRELSSVELARAAAPALADPSTSLADAIEEAAYRDQAQMIDSRHGASFRTRIALQALAAHDDIIAAALSQEYADRQEAWRDAYQAMLDGRGCRLRPDLDPDMLAVALTAAAQGLGLRAIAEGPDHIIDHARRTSILGMIATALAVACIDHGDGRPLREVADNISPARHDDSSAHRPPP
jgi:hypothetical protein